MLVLVLQRFLSKVSAKSNGPDWICFINAPKSISQTTRHYSLTCLSWSCRDSLAECQQKKQWPRLNLLHQRSKINLTNHEALFTHMLVLVLQRFLSRVSAKSNSLDWICFINAPKSIYPYINLTSPNLTIHSILEKILQTAFLNSFSLQTNFHSNNMLLWNQQKHRSAYIASMVSLWYHFF